MKQINGRVWKFGDNIDTDIIISANRLVLPLKAMCKYAMAPLDPEFANKVAAGDVIVAGRNFGCGSSREQAPAVLKALGIEAVIAKGFARIFFRNAINLGLTVIKCIEIYDHVHIGDHVQVTLGEGRIQLVEQSRIFSGSRLPDFLLEILAAGGLIPYLSADCKRG